MSLCENCQTNLTKKPAEAEPKKKSKQLTKKVKPSEDVARVFNISDTTCVEELSVLFKTYLEEKNLITAKHFKLDDVLTNLLKKEVGKEYKLSEIPKLCSQLLVDEKLKLRTGLMMPRRTDDKLKTFLKNQGIKDYEQISRTETTNIICSYIKNNKLQDAENKKTINCDDSLKSLFDSPTTSYTQIQKDLQNLYIDEKDVDKWSKSPELQTFLEQHDSKYAKVDKISESSIYNLCFEKEFCTLDGLKVVLKDDSLKKLLDIKKPSISKTTFSKNLKKLFV